MQKNLRDVAEEKALEAKAAESEARKLHKAEADLKRQQAVFNHHYEVDLSHITSMMSKSWRNRDEQPKPNNGRGSPRRGGATRRHRKRRITRRR